MNLGQILDGAVAKTVRYCDQCIRNSPDNTKNIISWLNDNVIYYLNEDKSYYNQVSNEIVNNLDDRDFRQTFVENVCKQNLFIEGPCFSHININKLNENLVNPNESMLIKKETIKYIKDKLKLKSDFVITDDIVRRNIFIAPMYINKLFKLTKNIMNTRDFGCYYIAASRSNSCR